MRSAWAEPLIARLTATMVDDGGWNYGPGRSAATEPTALAALALHAHRAAARLTVAALDWLAKHQQSNGAVAVNASPEAPGWTTALALLAWTRAAPPDSHRYESNRQQAARWLLQMRGQLVQGNTGQLGHDTKLTGWPWVDGTSSWIEPTAYAILALRAADQAEHPRVREGVRLLLDRAIPTGGWNYGNSRVLGSTLRPFPDTTGVALAALAGELRVEQVHQALAYLAGELPRIRAPLSLSWGFIGWRAWSKTPAAADTWLAEAAAQSLNAPPNAAHDALLLLAGAETCPLIETRIFIQTKGA